MLGPTCKCKASTNKIKHIHTQLETNIKAEEAVLSRSSVCFSDKPFLITAGNNNPDLTFYLNVDSESFKI